MTVLFSCFRWDEIHFRKVYNIPLFPQRGEYCSPVGNKNSCLRLPIYLFIIFKLFSSSSHSCLWPQMFSTHSTHREVLPRQKGKKDKPNLFCHTLSQPGNREKETEKERESIMCWSLSAELAVPLKRPALPCHTAAGTRCPLDLMDTTSQSNPGQAATYAVLKYWFSTTYCSRCVLQAQGYI